MVSSEVNEYETTKAASLELGPFLINLLTSPMKTVIRQSFLSSSVRLSISELMVWMR